MEGYQLSGKLVQDVQHLSYIITQEQKRLQCGKAKKIEVLDDFGNLQVRSSDIVDYNKWEYSQSEK